MNLEFKMPKQTSLILATVLAMVLIDSCSAIKIANMIPHYCGRNLELQTEFKTIELNGTNGSDDSDVLQLGASILQGIEIVPNYKCFLIVSGPVDHGLVLTIRKASLNDNDTIMFRSGSNPDGSWKPDPERGEVVALPNPDGSATITIKYEPTVGVSPVNAGFDLAVTVFKKKNLECGPNEFDCYNGRCIGDGLTCDGYNNCGSNEQDETGCHISWWLIGPLILLAITVAVLALLVWIRMSRG